MPQCTEYVLHTHDELVSFNNLVLYLDG